MIFLDFESYYDKDYSLRKMPVMQYVRDPRWRCLGCGIWHPGMPRPAFYPPEALPEVFARLDWSAAVAHNAAFDGAVLHRHYGVSPSYWYDTKLMLRYAISQGYYPPDAKTSLADHGDKGDTAAAVAAGGDELADYCVQDVRIMMRLFRELAPLVPRMELDLIDLHVRMATEPVLSLDRPLLVRAVSSPKHPLAAALRKKDTFVRALQYCGVKPGTKISPRTGEDTFAFAKTDPFMQSLAAHPDPRVRMLHRLRLEGGSNIDRTRANRYLAVGEPLPVPLLYYGAHTGRSSGQDKMNPQNLPRGGDLRRALRAPAGHKLVCADLSQIEVRVLAWLAGDAALLNVFREKRDPYIAFAAEVMLRKPASAVTREERRIAKPPVLACGYGQGPDGLMRYAASMGVILTARQAEQAVNGYRNRYRRITALWRTLERRVIADRELILPSGRKLIYPDLERRNDRELWYKRPLIFSKFRTGARDEVKIFGGKLAENLTQAVARDIVMWQTVQLARRYKVVLSIHDEVILCVPDRLAKQALADILAVFATAPPWADGLPVEGEGGIYINYAKEAPDDPDLQ